MHVRPSRQQGSILVVLLILSALMGLMLAAYLNMVGSQNRFTQRSQVWNNVMPVCESGVEEALAHINYSGTTSDFAINGWVLSNTNYVKTRTSGDTKCEMKISTDVQPVITVKGSILAPVQTNYISRRVRVKTKLNYRFPQAVLAKGPVALGGNAVVDSFNSADALYSTLGQYDPLKAVDNATVATNSKQPGNVSVGNGVIHGRVATGPGGTVILNKGTVGSSAWDANPANAGMIQPGYSTDDMNVYIPDAKLPVISGVIPASGTVGGINYTYVLGNGDYQLNSLSLAAGQSVIITGNARLYVKGDTSITSDAFIEVAAGASVEYYSGGNINMAGKGMVNDPGQAINFSLYGLPGCTSISYSGQAQFIGTVYAPEADIAMTGQADAIGAFVGNSVSMSGNMGLHYDESLRKNPNQPKYLVASWQEL